MGRGLGGGAVALSPKFGQLTFFTQHEKFGQSQLLEKFECVCVWLFFLRKEIFAILNCQRGEAN